MRIRSKEEVIGAYSKRYPELDLYFIQNLEHEYEKYVMQVKDIQTKEAYDAFFQGEIEKNEAAFRSDSLCEGLEDSINNQYMAILAAYGLIVFFRDTLIEL